jgi:UDP-glucuronate 4-epimerase
MVERERGNGPVLVTGAAGFIGFHVAERLLCAGQSVQGVDSLNDYYDPALKEARLERLQGYQGFAFERLDLSHDEAVMRLFERVRPIVVIHLAAQAGVRYSLDNPRAYVSANIDGFLAILEACRHVPTNHLLYASSSSVYGGNARLPFSEHDIADHPVSLYAATKRANELMAHTYAHLFGVKATGLRFFTVYGPWGRPDMAYFKFTKAIFEGREIDVYNHGRLSRDFTYVDDVTEAIVRLIDKPAAPDPSFMPRAPDPAIAAVAHRVYNIGNNTPVELGRFIEIVEESTGRTARKRMLPMQPGDVLATFADVSDLAIAVDFAPRTPLDVGIGRFVEWYRDFYGV